MRNLVKKGLSDKRISEITGISIATLSVWKKTEECNYRFKIYKLLKTMDESVLIEVFKKGN